MEYCDRQNNSIIVKTCVRVKGCALGLFSPLIINYIFFKYQMELFNYKCNFMFLKNALNL
jgi:hypothetical protein